MSEIGYVVVEFNQASGQPITDGYLYDTTGEAREAADEMQKATSAAGRRERWAVGTVTVEEED